MDYHNRAGSKKGTGGIASDAQLNLQRRKKVDELLRQGEETPYTFQETQGTEKDEEAVQLRRNPYIYKNHSGKLVCKLCNTMHMSWSSVERHLSGKKHGLNVFRREQLGASRGGGLSRGKGILAKVGDLETMKFQEEVEKDRLRIRNNGIVPECQIVQIRDEESGLTGICVKFDYNSSSTDDSDKHGDLFQVESSSSSSDNIEYPPFMRIVSSLETSSERNKDKDKDKDKKYLVVSYEPFENIAIEIPNDKDVVIPREDYTQENSVDELNAKCCYWDRDLKYFFVQLLFKGTRM